MKEYLKGHGYLHEKKIRREDFQEGMSSRRVREGWTLSWLR